MLYENTTTIEGRQRVFDRRDAVRDWARLASYLPKGPDRELALQCWHHGLTQAEASKNLGKHRTFAGKRLKKIKKRIQDPRFVLATLTPHALPKKLREFARPRIVEGLSLQSTATWLGISLHQCRSLDTELSLFVRGYVDGVKTGRAA